MGTRKQRLIALVLAFAFPIGSAGSAFAKERPRLRAQRIADASYDLLHSGRFRLISHPLSKYRPAPSANGRVILYRGDIRGLELKGIPSDALIEGRLEVVREAQRILESGDDEAIHRLIDRHTSSSHGSPLLSSSFSPKAAQLFAKTGQETLYRIEIDPSRAVLDADNLGGSGKQGEVLILGSISPSEITAVKIHNEDENSELLEGHWILRRPRADDVDFKPKSPANWTILNESFSGW